MLAIDVVVRRLYEAPPDGFVAARAAAIEDARKSGDRDAAKRLAALKKPTVAAWVVNLVALRRPELIEELVDLSTALRAAQRELRGDELRELSTQRRVFVSSLVAAARRLAVEESGTAAGKLPLGDVEATFTAALADPEIAVQVRSGRLIRAVSYAGFGEVPRPRLRLVTDADADADVDADVDADADADVDAVEAAEAPSESAGERAAAEQRRRADEQRRRESERRRRDLERELNTARADERRADGRLERAEDAEREAGHLVEDLDAELAELERRRTEAVADVARRKLARRSAEREAAAARRRVGDVQAALDELNAT
ncbi:hypothetical protein Q0Z83_095330 [Actinoplanes sichuanensis]|uniref:Transposase n=1 Tax=Actinoplanes sichuanensis TaxID=512349 RepID=A0ABW4AR70_9ACTN|nr:hypothetical protein [Actinoplanes sichuanensis]BEL11342.1 hypothetical protein Q0Z83_095330 [Actinoplanes sichuanensis]